ncbi:PNS1-like protein [Achlya hypogyna]|uniref:Choline transporter-like protein n=1 Tax=Achlya hypogyna TaxID=1202772 RepID=A0A1V9YAD8_ACHHY|nr:PNS1-like protein [Achlya hypogyna]
METAKVVNGPAPTEHSRSCKDVVFVILFLIVVAITVFFASNFGAKYISATQIHDVADTTGFLVVVRFGAISGAIAICISLLWILTMMFVGECIIWASIAFMIVANIAAAVYMTQRLHARGDAHYWWPAAVFGTVALLIFLYAVCIRHRVKFAAVHLRVAGTAIFRLPFTLVVALLMVGVQLAWATTSIVGAFGLLHHQGAIALNSFCAKNATMSKCDVTVQYGKAFGLMIPILLVFFWGAMVIKNVVAVTVSGTVASWKVNAAVPMITMVAWGRALTLNLGSICFGSLIVAILETIQTTLAAIAHVARQSGNCVAACIVGCLACLIGVLKSWMELFNRFAYAYVGIHGYSFITAGRKVSKLFNSKGWSAIVNDDLTQKVFFLGNIVVGTLAAFATIQIASNDLATNRNEFAGLKKPEATIGVFGFVIGYVVNNLFMSLMASAVTTIFVLWAEDPAGWQATQPTHYERLHAAWLKIYPDEYNNGAGKPDTSQA